MCQAKKNMCTHDSTVEAVRPKSFVTLRHRTQAKKPTQWWHIFPLCFRWASGQISVYSTKDTRPNVSHATSASCLSENNVSRRSFTLVFSAVHSRSNCPRHISEIWSKQGLSQTGIPQIRHDVAMTVLSNTCTVGHVPGLITSSAAGFLLFVFFNSKPLCNTAAFPPDVSELP